MNPEPLIIDLPELHGRLEVLPNDLGELPTAWELRDVLIQILVNGLAKLKSLN